MPYCQCVCGGTFGGCSRAVGVEATAGSYDEEMGEGRGARHSMAPRSLLQAWHFSLRIMGRY